MDEDSIKAAEAEAKRFLAVCKTWRTSQGTYESNGHVFNYWTPKQAGAVRRASMDLTRSLAAMRRPR